MTVTPSGPPAFQVLLVLTKGGGVLGSRQNDLKPSSLASPSHGSWAQLEDERQIGITGKNFRHSPAGDLVGSSKFRVRATLNEAGDRFSRPFTTQLLDLNGTVTATISGTVDASRIRIELPG